MTLTVTHKGTIGEDHASKRVARFIADGGEEVLEELITAAGYEGDWKYEIRGHAKGGAHDPPVSVLGLSIYNEINMKVRPSRGGNDSRVTLALKPPQLLADRHRVNRVRTDLAEAADQLKGAGKPKEPFVLTDALRRQILGELKTALAAQGRPNSKTTFVRMAFDRVDDAPRSYDEMLAALRQMAGEGLVLERDFHFAPTEQGNLFYFGEPLAEPHATPPAPPQEPKPEPKPEPRPEPKPARPAEKSAEQQADEAISFVDAMKAAHRYQVQLKDLRAQMGAAGAAVGLAERQVSELQKKHARQAEELRIEHQLELESLAAAAEAEIKPALQHAEAARQTLEDIKSYAKEIADKIKSSLSQWSNLE